LRLYVLSRLYTIDCDYLRLTVRTIHFSGRPDRWAVENSGARDALASLERAGVLAQGRVRGLPDPVLVPAPNLAVSGSRGRGKAVQDILARATYEDA
jgi:hypothetical protein